jgi:Acetyl-CoA dehydrogenase C-terminal like
LNAIHEGTFGIQALDLLGRKVRLDGGAALTILADRIDRTRALASDSDRLSRHAIALKRYWARIAEITQEIYSIDDVDTRLANAAPYLEAFGHVVVAWLWLDQAVISNIELDRTAAGEQDFHRGKLAACDYFFGWELPRVDSWLAVLSPVERTPLDAQESWL